MGSRVGRGMTASGQGALDIGRSGDRPTRHGTCTSGAAAGSVDHDDSTPGRACQAAATHTKSAPAPTAQSSDKQPGGADRQHRRTQRLGAYCLHCVALLLALRLRFGWPSPEFGEQPGGAYRQHRRALRRSSPALFRFVSCVLAAPWLAEPGARTSSRAVPLDSTGARSV